jgi:hypothetical protein
MNEPRTRKKLSIRQKVAVLAVAAATVLGGSVLTAAPAMAGTGDCGTAKFCAWNNADYKSFLSGWSGDSQAWSVSYRNKATSLYNNGNTCDIRFYDEINKGGYYGDLARGAVYAQLASWWIVWPTVNFDNRIEGHVWRC